MSQNDKQYVRLQLWGKTKLEWNNENPVLRLNEMGIEKDTRKFKFGDGITPWINLPYALDTPDNIQNGEAINALRQYAANATGESSAAFGQDKTDKDEQGYNLEMTVIRGYDETTEKYYEDQYFYKDSDGNIIDNGNHTGDLGVEEQPEEMSYYNDKEIGGPKIPILSNYQVDFSTTGAFGDYSFTEGHNTFASGNSAHAEGLNTFAGGNYSHTEGHETTAFGYDAHAEGHKSSANGQATHSEGMRNTAIGKASHAEGLKNTTDFSAFSAHAEGEMNYIDGAASHAEGRKNFIYGNIYKYDLNGGIVKDENGKYVVETFRGNYAHAEGYGNTILAEYAHAEGYGHTIELSAPSGHAEGHGNLVSGEYAHAEGRGTKAKGPRSHTEGSATEATGSRAHAEGETTLASGNYSHAEGFKATAEGECSHAEGGNKKLTPGEDGADDVISTAPVHKITIDDEEHEIVSTKAKGIASHAEGSQGYAYGFASHAEGYRGAAIGNYSHAENNLTEARGDNSHAEGMGTVAYGNNQHVQGKYNVIDKESKYAHIIGNGTGLQDASRKNIHTVDWNGNAWFNGDVYVHSTSGQNKDAGSKKLLTSEDVAVFRGSDQRGTSAQQDGAQAVGDGSSAFGVSLINNNDRSFYVQYTHNNGVTYNSIDINSTTPSKPSAPTRVSYEDKSGTKVADFSVIYTPKFVNTGARSFAAHSEGDKTLAGGPGSHAEGRETFARAPYSHAEGWITFADGNYASHAEGYLNTASGEGAHAEGVANNAKANGAHVEGSLNTCLGQNAHVEGESSLIVSGSDASHSEGKSNIIQNKYSHAEGYFNKVTGYAAHAEGWQNTSVGSCAHTEGRGTTTNGDYAHAAGYYTTAQKLQYVIGHYNSNPTGTAGTDNQNGHAFIIGNGSASSPSNAFRVSYNGTVYSKYTTMTTGADYAEYFEWADNNPNNEDRRGYFVTLNEDKIQLAKPEDYILGIISGLPSIIGNADEDWRGRYITDEFGDFVSETFEYEEDYVESVFDEETQSIISETKTRVVTGTRYKENPDYDPSQTYIPRADRPEWAAVGMLGVLSVRDDGTCQVNGYCTVADGGIATASETGYRVIKRVNDHIVKVVFK